MTILWIVLGVIGGFIFGALVLGWILKGVIEESIGRGLGW